MKHIVKVEEVEGELCIVFPEGLCEGLGWKEGDSINWKENEDGSWTISKIENNQRS